MKHLAVFDFDHTIVDGNTDVHVHTAAPGGHIPPSLKKNYVKGRWLDFMNSIFQYMFECGVDIPRIKSAIEEMELTNGMPALLQMLKEHKKSFDVLILSDSNTFFIQSILDNRGLADVPTSIITNPAEIIPPVPKFNSLSQGNSPIHTPLRSPSPNPSSTASAQPHAASMGTGSRARRASAITSTHPRGPSRLLVRPFHASPHGCLRCNHNLCKARALGDFLTDQRAKHVSYNRIIYIGDGANDLCPCYLLSPQDVVMPRGGFQLEKLVMAHQLPKGVRESELAAANAQAAQQLEMLAAAIPGSRKTEGKAAEGQPGAGEDTATRGGTPSLPCFTGVGGRRPKNYVHAQIVKWESGHDIAAWLSHILV
eukprot:CAMPEP_0202913686 /NCGR_PEP_ID=MMETSP1392-20130828/61150_1 /ASSEMBLY_ACC=CAM_ASM_000868 /TAXON_ID=225041 /ORGANISM="Chlamydomonas chlamydogama, Strain SAG 11-48b" /LENGTH=367 /DNA_ID=CAMNT_0049605041 /DNA_START=146 /DNA_END=1249 /DNA_ORIENTATION=-